jgi:hypothetical protein
MRGMRYENITKQSLTPHHEVMRDWFSLQIGTGGTPVVHAQDVRATSKLNQYQW